MVFDPPLINATIKKRYKRFLADVVLENEEEITVHVPNTGSMTNCWGPDWPILLSKSHNPKRKYQYTLEMTHNGDSFIGVNTSLTNKLVLEALREERISELDGYKIITSEKTFGDSRLDFFLENNPKRKDCFVEVKNVTLNHGDTAVFPDAVTTRGQKHLKELIKLVDLGHRAVMLFIIAREDTETFAPAIDIDPEYAALLKTASKKGVEVLAYQCRLSKRSIKVHQKVEICL